MDIALSLLILAVQLYTYILVGRLIFTLVFAFARDWRPTGAAAVLVEGLFAVTDPIIKPLRRVIPPLRLGGLRFDLAFLTAFVGLAVVSWILIGLQTQL